MNNKETPPPAISRRIALHEISEKGHEFSLNLDETARARLAEELDLVNFTAFTCKARLTPRHKQRFRMKAQITADFSQNSAISLEPVPIHMEEPFETEFWPEAQSDPAVSPELELDYADEMIEFYRGESLDVGQVIYEQFVIALEQFPRGEGEIFDWQGNPEMDDDTAGGKENPFAVLKKLQQ